MIHICWIIHFAGSCMDWWVIPASRLSDLGYLEFYNFPSAKADEMVYSGSCLQKNTEVTELGPSTGMNWPWSTTEGVPEPVPFSQYSPLFPDPLSLSERKRLFDLFAAGKCADKFAREAEKWGSLEVNSGWHSKSLVSCLHLSTDKVTLLIF